MKTCNLVIKEQYTHGQLRQDDDLVVDRYFPALHRSETIIQYWLIHGCPRHLLAIGAVGGPSCCVLASPVRWKSQRYNMGVLLHKITGKKHKCQSQKLAFASQRYQPTKMSIAASVATQQAYGHLVHSPEPVTVLYLPALRSRHQPTQICKPPDTHGQA